MRDISADLEEAVDEIMKANTVSDANNTIPDTTALTDSDVMEGIVPIGGPNRLNGILPIDGPDHQKFKDLSLYRMFTIPVVNKDVAMRMLDTAIMNEQKFKEESFRIYPVTPFAKRLKEELNIQQELHCIVKLALLEIIKYTDTLFYSGEPEYPSIHLIRNDNNCWKGEVHGNFAE